MKTRWLLVALLAATIGCGGSTTTPTSSSSGNGGTSSSGSGGGGTSGGGGAASNRGTISATIDGVPWSGVVSTALSTNLSLSVAGEDTAGLIVGFGTSPKVGTTSVALGSVTTGTLQQGNSAWDAGLTKGSGSVTITTITSSSATGTFSFTMVPLPNTAATGNRVVTNGVFSVTF